MADREKLTAEDLKNIKTANELFQKQVEIEKNLVAQEQKLNDARGRRTSAIQKEMEQIAHYEDIKDVVRKHFSEYTDRTTLTE